MGTGRNAPAASMKMPSRCTGLDSSLSQDIALDLQTENLESPAEVHNDNHQGFECSSVADSASYTPYARLPRSIIVTFGVIIFTTESTVSSRRLLPWPERSTLRR